MSGVGGVGSLGGEGVVINLNGVGVVCCGVVGGMGTK